MLTGFYDEAITEVETRVGIVYGKTSTTDENGVVTVTDAYLPDTAALLPKELKKSISYNIISEWFLSIGELELSELYSRNFENEVAKYRFAPSRSIANGKGYLKYKPLR